MAQRQNVTITSDASYYYQEKVGGWAFQIRHSSGVIKLYGALRGEINNPLEAELKSVLNSLHTLKSQNIKVDTLTINVDCLYIVTSLFKRNKKRNKLTEELSIKISDYLEDIDYLKLNIKHVKAHRKIEDARGYVNDWCDKHARMGSEMATKIKKSN